MQVRLFAALRDAAGASVVEVDATTVAGIVAELGARHGEPMRSRLAAATVFADDMAIRDLASTRDLGDAAEVVVVPPFAGG